MQCGAWDGGYQMSTLTVTLFLTAAGLSRAVFQRNASLMSAFDPKEVGGTSIDEVLLAGKDDGHELNGQAIDSVPVVGPAQKLVQDQ